MTLKKYITLTDLARRLGLPAAWLRAEAEAGRIPSLRADRRLMFDAQAVERCLTDRAGHGEGAADDQ